MIDTHTHIYLEEFDADRDEVMRRAFDAGVRHLVFPNVDFDTFDAMHRLHDAYPFCTSMAMGFHPTSVDAGYMPHLDRTLKEIVKGGYIAVGEIGMDLYWDATFLKEQQTVLKEQLRIASVMNLPAIIHCRNAVEEIMRTFDECDFALPRMVFHSFTGTADDIDRLRVYGDFYFGFNGIVTFKNARLEPAVLRAGLDRVLLETDSPYLAPVPHRGKRNESSFLPAVAARLAAILDVPVSEIVERTTANAHALFTDIP